MITSKQKKNTKKNIQKINNKDHMYLTKHKIFILWPLVEKVVDPCPHKLQPSRTSSTSSRTAAKDQCSRTHNKCG